MNSTRGTIRSGSDTDSSAVSSTTVGKDSALTGIPPNRVPTTPTTRKSWETRPAIRSRKVEVIVIAVTIGKLEPKTC